MGNCWVFTNENIVNSEKNFVDRATQEIYISDRKERVEDNNDSNKEPSIYKVIWASTLH